MAELVRLTDHALDKPVDGPHEIVGEHVALRNLDIPILVRNWSCEDDKSPESISVFAWLTESLTSSGTLGSKGAIAMPPSAMPQPLKIGSHVPSITVEATQISLSPRVKPAPLIQYSGANS